MVRLTLLALAWVSQLAPVTLAQEFKSITEAESVIAIYTNDWGLLSSGDAHLILSIWGDGTVVWSNDQVNGGPPYFAAQIDAKEVSATLERLVDIGVFDVPRLKRARFGPDSQFTTLLVRTAGAELKMDSWHELFESRGKIVAADHGLTGLDGKKLLSVLAEQPAEYLLYRLAWSEIRLAAANLIPKSGKEIAGAPRMLHGKLSWRLDGDKAHR